VVFTTNLRVQPILTLNLLTTTIVAPPSNASKWQIGFNSAFKGLRKSRAVPLLPHWGYVELYLYLYHCKQSEKSSKYETSHKEHYAAFSAQITSTATPIHHLLHKALKLGNKREPRAATVSGSALLVYG
jgi:hypothetical protein